MIPPHSDLRLPIGLLKAAFRVCMLIVKSVIAMDEIPAIAKTRHLILVR